MSLKLFAVRAKSSKSIQGAPTFSSKQEAKNHRRSLNTATLEDNSPETLQYVVTFGPDHHRYRA